MSTRLERQGDKALNEQHTKILKELMLRPENRKCADCRKRDPRWASWNLGIFFCIRCSGFHRSLGTHISKVKSADLDTWTPEQIEIASTSASASAQSQAQASGQQSASQQLFDAFQSAPAPAAKQQQQQQFKDSILSLYGNPSSASGIRPAGTAAAPTSGFAAFNTMPTQQQQQQQSGFGNFASFTTPASAPATASSQPAYSAPQGLRTGMGQFIVPMNTAAMSNHGATQAASSDFADFQSALAPTSMPSVTMQPLFATNVGTPAPAPVPASSSSSTRGNGIPDFAGFSQPSVAPTLTPTKTPIPITTNTSDEWSAFQ
eukprot:jgi/Hompol1/6052/HPOL_000264-RA